MFKPLSDEHILILNEHAHTMSIDEMSNSMRELLGVEYYLYSQSDAADEQEGRMLIGELKKVVKEEVHFAWWGRRLLLATDSKNALFKLKLILGNGTTNV